METRKKTGIILSLLGIISIVLITAGVTYAFFSYTKEGVTENTITTGTITFLYTEVEQAGAGISIEDALPTTDEVGKAQTGAGNVFNFTVTATTAGQASIPFEVTARMKDTSTLDQDAIKLYLTEVDGDNETQLLLNTYNNLTQTSVAVPGGTVEKTIYTDTVAANSTYAKDFRLRLWVPEAIDYSEGDYNGKEFTVTVNVYANAEVVKVGE